MEMESTERQEQWKRICDSMRNELEKIIPEMNGMTEQELEKFIDAARSLQALEREIETQDAEVNRRIEQACRTWESAD